MLMQDAFRKAVSILLILSQIGCSNLKTIDAPPEALHERIRQGDLIKAGDSVRIVTEDEREHRFVVTGITTNEIHGKFIRPSSDGNKISHEEVVTIPIDSIVAVKTEEFSAGKSAALAGGISGALILLGMAIASAGFFVAGAP